MPLEYATPETLPTGTTCRSLFIPNNEMMIGAVTGALKTLIDSFNWEKVGAITPEEAADAMVEMFDKFCFKEGVCRMVGELILWSGIGAPDAENLLLCDGTHYSDADYPALWDIIGTTYGGTGSTDFALPDLRGKVAMGENSVHFLGTTGGVETVTLTTAEMPSHNHSDSGHIHALAGEVLGFALAPGELPVDVPGTSEFTGIGNASISNTGGGDAHENLQPYLVLNYYIVAS